MSTEEKLIEKELFKIDKLYTNQMDVLRKKIKTELKKVNEGDRLDNR
jgi:hypothetical protein